MSPIVDQFLKYFGQIVLVGGSGAAVAFALFRFLGKSWIESKFAERLESFKHQQAVELQRLRVQIESMLSGALKLQELEFTVLPEAWKKLDDAYGLACWITASLQEYPSIEKMTDAELTEYLTKSQPKWSQNQLRKIMSVSGRARTDAFHDALAWQRLNRAKQAASELETFIAAKGLFLPPPIKRQFLEIIPIIHGGLITAETSQQVRDYAMLSRAGTDLRAVSSMHKAIESAIEDRLHSHARRTGDERVE